MFFWADCCLTAPVLMNRAVRSVELNFSEQTDLLSVRHSWQCLHSAENHDARVCVCVCVCVVLRAYFSVWFQMYYLFLSVDTTQRVRVIRLSQWFKAGFTCLFNETNFSPSGTETDNRGGSVQRGASKLSICDRRLLRVFILSILIMILFFMRSKTRTKTSLTKKQHVVKSFLIDCICFFF